MDLRNYQNFFLKLVELICEYPTLYKKLKSYGIRSIDWPECKARILMGDFEFIASTRDEACARLEISLRDKGKSDFGEIPLDPQYIKVHHDLYRDAGKAFQLAEKINQEPLRATELIRAYQKNNLKIETESWDDGLKSSFVEQNEDLKSGLSQLILPSWNELSKMIGGFNPGRISVLTAQTGFGKTTLALNLAIDAKTNWPVLYVNMEMIPKDIYARTIFATTGITYQEWKTKPFEYFAERAKKIENYTKNAHQLRFTNGKDLNPIEIRALIHYHADVYGTKIVFIDYDQKLKSDVAGEEWQLLNKAIVELEETAKETNTFILLLAQADDNGDPRASKRMKQSASSVIHFKKIEDSIKGEIYVLQAIKNRFGRTNQSIEVEYNPEQSYIKEIGIYNNPEAYLFGQQNSSNGNQHRGIRRLENIPNRVPYQDS